MLNIELELKNIIINIAKERINDDDILEGVNLVNDLGFSSVQIIELVIDIEKTFNIEIDDEDMDIDVLTSYAGLKNLIIRKTNS